MSIQEDSIYGKEVATSIQEELQDARKHLDLDFQCFS